ncbi:ABC transporter substrate-binding protein [Lysinibacillus sp. NPDC093216]|uniref:ABC transporter substrate-binding protein n=2 Tax=unclassified Lysinibacillus TaxID=2636778 RepID=UPI003D04A517
MKNYSYFQMRAFLYPREEQQTAECKLYELESLWFCTQKSVKRKLKQFGEAGKLIYAPGKGRGNPSQIVFYKPFQQEIEDAVKQLVQRDQLEEVILLLQLPIPKTWIANVSQEIQSLFGIQSSGQPRDVLRTARTRELTTLDPLHTSITFETFIIYQLGDTLVTYNQEQDTVIPHIAHNWESDNEGKTWTFYLRKGVRFHNQHLLTSEDVRYTLDRFKTSSSPHSWLVEDIDQIECLSPFTIRFKLFKPNALFPRFLSFHNLVILPVNEPFDENKWIGTVPFQIKKRTDNLLVLQAFDNYFLTRPILDEIEIYRVPIETTHSAMYEVQNHNETITTYQHKQDIEVGFRFLSFNFKRNTIVHNAAFREAIYHLMDVRKLWKDLGRSNLQEASSYFFWKSKHQTKDIQRVQSLLEEAGYQGELITVYTLDKQNCVEEAEWVKQEARKFGLHLDVKVYSISDYYDPSLEEADLLMMGEVASMDHHLSFLGAFLNKALIFNRFLSNAHLENLNVYFEKIKQATDWQTRECWINEVECYIRQENLFLYLNHPIKSRIFHPMIKDIQFDSFGFVDFRKLWIK